MKFRKTIAIAAMGLGTAVVPMAVAQADPPSPRRAPVDVHAEYKLTATQVAVIQILEVTRQDPEHAAERVQAILEGLRP